MEFINCNLCGLGDTQLLFTVKDKFGISQDEFHIVECQKCGLVYVSPRPTPDEIGKFYPETYSWKKTLKAESIFTRWIRKLENSYRYHLLRDEVLKVMKLTERHSGKVLDIGCGTGDRLEVFRKMGFEVFGVETSDFADYAKENLKLNVVKGDIFSAHFPDNFFNMITLYHVLEHTHNPTWVLEEIYRILEEGGFLVIQVPINDCLQFKLFKERWTVFDVPRHLYYFRVTTLRTLLEKVGFKILKIDHFMNLWHPPTLVLSLFPTLDPQIAWQREVKGYTTVFQRIAWIFFTFLAIPFTQFESWVGRGAIVTFYMVKPPLSLKKST